MFSTLTAAALVTMLLGAPGQNASDIRVARAVLSRSTPAGLAWRFSQRLDINCDGVRDLVFTATSSDKFYVGVVLGPITSASRQSTVSLMLGGHSQDSLCGPFSSLKPEPLSSPQDLRDAIGEDPDGYRYSANCSGLRLLSGECDSFHMYWDHDHARLAWWRV